VGSPTIDTVISCPQLPSLPAIAAQVLELTRRPDVPIREIASVVQNDQALAGKILKTVNSSYYALESPCPSIDRAMSYMGINTVKSLVLGFSFMDSFKGLPGDEADHSGFNLTAHWRRAIYGAASARVIANSVDSVDPDEAFLAALMQDIGMLAMFVTFKEQYAEALSLSEHDNERVIDCEQEAFGFDHTQVGSALAQKWHLPASISETALHHHDPGNAPSSYATFIRCGGLASLMASVAANEACERDMELFAQRARAWFGMDREAAEHTLKAAVDGAVELSSLFEVETGRRPDLSRLLADASEALVEHQIQTQRQADELAQQANTDGLTNIANRKRFDELLKQEFDKASSSDTALSVLFCDADKFKPLNDTHGHQAGDAVLIQLAKRLSETVGEAGTVCRYGGEEFAAVLPGLSADEAAKVAELCRLAVESKPFDLRDAPCGPDELPVTISAGIATREAGSGSMVRSCELLLRAADKAVYAAKDGGRNCVRILRFRNQPKTDAPQSTAPRAKTASATSKTTKRGSAAEPSTAPLSMQSQSSSAYRILLVEDDPIQQKLLSMPLVKHDGYSVDLAGDGQTALDLLDACNDSDDQSRYDLILIDIGLPDKSGVEVVRHIRSSPALAIVPIVVLSASEAEKDIRDCLLAGANAYITKQSLCDDPKSRILSIVDFWTSTSQAA